MVAGYLEYSPELALRSFVLSTAPRRDPCATFEYKAGFARGVSKQLTPRRKVEIFGLWVQPVGFGAFSLCMKLVAEYVAFVLGFPKAT